jgi:hypothetical protein
MGTASRWWWWVASLPISVAFWILTVVWLAIATEGTGLLGNPIVSGAALATVGLAVPLLVIAVIFPAAVYFDARALGHGDDMAYSPGRLGLAAAASLLTGPILSVPFACWYIWHRHEVVGIP